MINELEIILYVSDQAKSRDFYSAILGLQPVLDVPGMTEFEIHPGMKLGLMPESGIAKIIGANLPHPSGGNGIPRCELYLLVNDAEVHYDMALKLGAKPVSPVKSRDWGHSAGYIADHDGHVIAFAKKNI